MIDHVSFSAIKEYKNCPHKFKLIYIDKNRGASNIYTVFGESIHHAIDAHLKNTETNKDEEFLSTFDKNLTKIETGPSSKEIEEYRKQGINILQEVIPALKETFGNFDIVGSEIDLLETIAMFGDKEIKFKGFVDLFIKSPKDNKYHVIDFKTCSWGWDMEKRTDTLASYQLTWYKFFLSKKLNIPLEEIETHFVLLKRTAKSNRVEPIRITSGKIKVKNSNEFLSKSIQSILKSIFIKNRMSCKYCQFYKTDKCP